MKLSVRRSRSRSRSRRGGPTGDTTQTHQMLFLMYFIMFVYLCFTTLQHKVQAEIIKLDLFQSLFACWLFDFVSAIWHTSFSLFSLFLSQIVVDVLHSSQTIDLILDLDLICSSVYLLSFWTLFFWTFIILHFVFDPCLSRENSCLTITTLSLWKHSPFIASPSLSSVLHLGPLFPLVIQTFLLFTLLNHAVVLSYWTTGLSVWIL